MEILLAKLRALFTARRSFFLFNSFSYGYACLHPGLTSTTKHVNHRTSILHAARQFLHNEFNTPSIWYGFEYESTVIQCAMVFFLAELNGIDLTLSRQMSFS